MGEVEAPAVCLWMMVGVEVVSNSFQCSPECEPGEPRSDDRGLEGEIGAGRRGKSHPPLRGGHPDWISHGVVECRHPEALHMIESSGPGGIVVDHLRQQSVVPDVPLDAGAGPIESN